MDRLFQDSLGALELYTVYLGERLGLYRSLAEDGPATSVELANRTNTAERYVREWLEHHAASGLLDVDDAKAEPLLRKYRLPSEHIRVLADPDDVRYEAYRGVDIVRAARPLPQLVDAFRTGAAPPSLPWEPEGRAEFNRALFLNLLGKEWLPAITEVDRRLRSEPPARVADVACGTGWSSIAIAKAYPRARIDGFDLDEPSVELARANAAEHGVADRVSFQVQDVADPSLTGRYDLVVAFEMLHDLSRPIEALRVIRGLLADGGAVIIMDEKVAETFTAPGDDLERFFYGFSTLCCLPAGMAEQPSAATGTVMRPDTMRRYALEAGFRDVEILPIEHDLFRFYRPHP